MKIRKTSQVLVVAVAGMMAGNSKVCLAQVASTAAPSTTFTNPLLEGGPDPWVVYWKGFYYYSNTTGANVTLLKTRDLSDLRHAEKVVVWTPEPGHPWSKELWAPELHRWGNKWYIYVAADAGSNEGHRIYVLENASEDPVKGTYVLKGKITDATDKWAIDATTFEVNGQHYMVWSGWEGDKDGEQDLFIAHMSNAWTIDSPRTKISTPALAFETHGDLPGRHVNVNEGPEFLRHGDRMFVVYSASGCWTDHYSLGVLEAKVSSNPLDAASWTKLDHPFLSTDAAAEAFSPGHNGFFKSPDGKEDWIIYHANPAAGEGCGSMRSPRMQRFTWNADGTPNFGEPAALGKSLAKPSR